MVYGLGKDPVAVTVEWPELRRALTTEAGLNALITLELDGQQDLTIMKDLQRDPVRRTSSTSTSSASTATSTIAVEVPIVLHGEAKEVENNQGIVVSTLADAADALRIIEAAEQSVKLKKVIEIQN